MKIVGKDNFDREHISEHLVCTDVNRYYGKLIVTYLNFMGGDHSPNFYTLVEDDYVLYEFKP